ncbi:taste receptor type 2 member 40-like [Pleurodeles waltl]|uniref:taste receptor type 2 member 40-like n=1 Tax=Pleurodeles waltl TaxID=8319 RepID=UPI0037096368
MSGLYDLITKQLYSQPLLEKLRSHWQTRFQQPLDPTEWEDVLEALDRGTREARLKFCLFKVLHDCTFIVGVISTQWAGTRHQPPTSDLFLLFLGLTNIFMQGFTSSEQLLRLLQREMYNKDSVWKTFLILSPFFYFSSFWLNAWICVFYCIKIVNFSHPLCLRLKFRISAMLPWLVVVSLLASLAVNVSRIWSFGELPTNISTTINATSSSTSDGIHLFHKLLMFITGCLVPQIMIVITAVLVLTSLYRHTRRMQQNNTGFTTGPSVEAHTSAAKTILSLVTLYACFTLAAMLGVKDENWYTESATYYIYMFIGVSYPSINSLILIFGNPKLKEAAKNIVCSSLRF